jgi:hypothetical protein
MANNSESVTIVGSRATREGLLVKFSDRTFYMFHTSFLVENRESRGDRILNPSRWLAENWQPRRLAAKPSFEEPVLLKLEAPLTY